jgi:hypothetical protein
VDSDEELPYKERLIHCKAAVHQFLSHVFQDAGIRGVPWPMKQDPRPIREWIARCAMVLATLRSEPVREGTWGTDYTSTKKEQPRRAYAVLRNIARGHALVHGRLQLTHDDLPAVAQVTTSTMPSECSRLFTALVQKELTVAQAQAALGVRSPQTARAAMKRMDSRGVMEFIEEGQGRPALLVFRPPWEWCTSSEFRAILLG